MNRHMASTIEDYDQRLSMDGYGMAMRPAQVMKALGVSKQTYQQQVAPLLDHTGYSTSHHPRYTRYSVARVLAYGWEE